jgi:malonate-semialdehyde dehydrogenase (acetylating) / methylmalonate-semialdehyde dehydrogenase
VIHQETPTVPHLIGGRWLTDSSGDFTPVHNPSTEEIIARTPKGTRALVDEAVKSGSEAFKDWSRTPPSTRTAILFRYRSLLEENFESLAYLVTRENGKTREEARGDVRRGIEVVEFACGIAQLLKGEFLPQVADGIDGTTSREPIGVCAGITPFNFPAMVPMWMFPISIACGNSFVLKPSEKVPLTSVRLAELLLEAGLPPGVFNVIQGGREVVDSLCTHPDVAAISFVGSSAVAKHVYTLATSRGKRVQAAGGAKNVLVVMPDADPDGAVKAVMGSAFGCAGQRCMAGSILMTVGDDRGVFAELVHAAADHLTVADTSADTLAGMGPVIDGPARMRIEGWIDRSEQEGAQLARDGRKGRPERGYFVSPTLFEAVTPGMSLFDEEIFGPVLAMARPRNLDEAIEWAHRSGYGNGATIFTSSGGAARRFVREIPCGMVGVNVGVPAPMALFSFSGWRNSFFGDLHVQGMEGIFFNTRQKIVLSRWESTGDRRNGW